MCMLELCVILYLWENFLHQLQNNALGTLRGTLAVHVPKYNAPTRCKHLHGWSFHLLIGCGEINFQVSQSGHQSHFKASNMDKTLNI